MSAKDRTIWFGDYVRDRISGYKGIAVSRHQFMYGCERWGVTPKKLGKENKPDEMHTFDTPQLEVIKKNVVKSPIPFDDGLSVNPPGGPRDDMAALRKLPKFR